MDDGIKVYRVATQEYTATTADMSLMGAGAVETGIAEPPAPRVAANFDGQRRFDALFLRAGSYLQVKRVQDIVFALGFLLSGGLVLFPLIALLIKLDSPGPVFFRQERVGWLGRRFLCLKFRTMTHDPKACFVQAQKNDPRITRIGSFLRKTNLDELPQFINVLLGDMSVVGPRPHVYELDLMHCDTVPGYKLRTCVRPGVTGLAQVSGCRGETRNARDMEHRIRFDLFYVRNMNFMLDLRIVLLTVVRVLQGDSKAY
ncbi:MAG TPA: sugar transferase [Verrucomicrobiae bacterium]|nr:sugar transferase [Verrucomicrobiae bacterium]